MKIATPIDIKKSMTDLHDVAGQTGEYIALMQTAFIYNTSSPLHGYRKKVEDYKREAAHLSEVFAEAGAESANAKAYETVPDHLSRIWNRLEKLSSLIDEKINDKVLFSDKAVDETIYLLQRLTEILKPVSDMILARNIFLRKYVEESQSSIEKMAAEYATLHENRLVTGDCMPTASSIFVGMLDAIKSIAWHTKEIAVVLGK